MPLKACYQMRTRTVNSSLCAVTTGCGCRAFPACGPDFSERFCCSQHIPPLNITLPFSPSHNGTEQILRLTHFDAEPPLRAYNVILTQAAGL